jgi:hypothetical protein
MTITRSKKRFQAHENRSATRRVIRVTSRLFQDFAIG